MRLIGRFPWVRALAIIPIIADLAHGAPGDLDPTFGNGGKVRTALSPYGATASAVALQPDGKVVVAGFVLPDFGTYAFAIVRYNADGSLDTSFGENGVTKTSFGPGASAIGSAVALQP